MAEGKGRNKNKIMNGSGVLEPGYNYFALRQMTSSLLRRSINASTLPVAA
jgi:hypothetical protein